MLPTGAPAPIMLPAAALHVLWWHHWWLHRRRAVVGCLLGLWPLHATHLLAIHGRIGLLRQYLGMVRGIAVGAVDIWARGRAVASGKALLQDAKAAVEAG